MSISEDFPKREYLRSQLFGETWQTLIAEVFRDVPTYYDKGNAVASLGSCAWWSAGSRSMLASVTPTCCRSRTIHSMP
jgi:hypothetical protein